MPKRDPGTYVELSPEWDDPGWFRFPRSIARDPRLSHQARGLACQLASHSSRFRFETKELAEKTRNGRDAVRAMIRELETAGYLSRVPQRDSNGRRGAMIYKLHPYPQVETKDGNPGVGSDQAKQCDQEDQGLESRALVSSPTENQRTENPPSLKESTEGTTPEVEHHQIAPQGAAVADAPEPADDGGLFEAPQTEQATPERSPAQRVVAAYVDSFRAKSGGSDPLRQDIAKVAGVAARLVKDAGVDLERLQIAAGRLAGTGFTDLAGEYRRMMTGNDRRTGSAGIVPDVNDPRSVIYSGKDYWAAEAEKDAQAKADRQAAIARGEIAPDPIYF